MQLKVGRNGISCSHICYLLTGQFHNLPQGFELVYGRSVHGPLHEVLSSNETPTVGRQLNSKQQAELEASSSKFSDMMKNSPGHTTLAEHQIKTGSSPPICQSPYRLVHTRILGHSQERARRNAKVWSN